MENVMKGTFKKGRIIFVTVALAVGIISYVCISSFLVKPLSDEQFKKLESVARATYSQYAGENIQKIKINGVVIEQADDSLRYTYSSVFKHLSGTVIAIRSDEDISLLRTVNMNNVIYLRTVMTLVSIVVIWVLSGLELSVFYCSRTKKMQTTN